jgi:hypothetical protein
LWIQEVTSQTKAAVYQRKRRESNPTLRERDRARMRDYYKRRMTDPALREKERTRLREYKRSTPLEITVEDHLREHILALGGLCMKFIDPGQKGAPDRLVVLPGSPTFYVELKRPRRGELKDHQKRYHQRLRDRGQRVWVLWSKADVDAFISEVTLT